jgi:hypothetical protein
MFRAFHCLLTMSPFGPTITDMLITWSGQSFSFA